MCIYIHTYPYISILYIIIFNKHITTSHPFSFHKAMLNNLSLFIWVNYNISLT